ncbi:MAG: zinc-dependent alcohol dehydrogenase family protein [Lachnospiraceae bacterium]|nr:zinc-dependent alcohol dehydrogenase family protein [Lachnospiraceae bacterium]
MQGTMKAAFFEGNGVLEIRETEIPVLDREDEMLLKVEACSICGTDVHVLSVPPSYPMEPGNVLGHELVGQVVKIGPAVKKFKIGDRVVVNPNEYCGKCRYCQANLPNHCENIVPMGLGGEGGFAEYIKATEKMSYKIKKDLPTNLAVFAEPLACVVNGMQKVRPNPGESVLIIGAGPIGLIFLKLMKSCGVYPIIVSEPSAVRREFAKKMGADYVVDPMKENLEERVLEITSVGVDLAADVVGSQMSQAISCARRGGTVLLFGVNTSVHPAVSQSDIVQKELRVQGTWLANATFPKAVAILEAGKVELEPLITHVLPLEQLEQGVNYMRSGEGVEVIIDFSL